MGSLPSSPFVIRADDLRASLGARSLLAEAEAEAARIRAHVSAERQEALADAHREGLRRGLAEAAALALAAATAIDEFWHEREAELAEVSLAIAHRVLSSLPQNEAVARLALDAVAEHARDVRLSIRVRPEVAGLLRAMLDDGEHSARVEVVADPAAAAGDCTLVHAQGRTDVGLLAQFRAMLHSLATPDQAGRERSR